MRPRVLLLDEPLSALDAQIRRSMVEEIAKLHADLPDLTILYVTHDQSEALTLADRIAILKDGELCAIGRTGELYRRPPNRFAAEFLGRANLLPVVVEGDAPENGFVAVRVGERQARRRRSRPSQGAQRLLCVRPQNLTLTGDEERSNRILGRASRNSLAGRIDASRRGSGGRDPARRWRRGCRNRRRAASLSISSSRPPTPTSSRKTRVSDAVLATPRTARFNWVGWWIAPPLAVLALLFLYPLILIARAAFVDDGGALTSARWSRP